MPWFKVDDKFHCHPKLADVPLAARGLWVTAGSWSADQLTDGFIPKAMLRRWGATRRQARALVEADLWIECEQGFQFHDWGDHQPSGAKIKAKREADAKRKRSQRDREKASASREESGGSHTVTPEGHNGASGGSHGVTPSGVQNVSLARARPRAPGSGSGSDRDGSGEPRGDHATEAEAGNARADAPPLDPTQVAELYFDQWRARRQSAPPRVSHWDQRFEDVASLCEEQARMSGSTPRAVLEDFLGRFWTSERAQELSFKPGALRSEFSEIMSDAGDEAGKTAAPADPKLRELHERWTALKAKDFPDEGDTAELRRIGDAWRAREAELRRSKAG